MKANERICTVKSIRYVGSYVEFMFYGGHPIVAHASYHASCRVAQFEKIISDDQYLHQRILSEGIKGHVFKWALEDALWRLKSYHGYRSHIKHLVKTLHLNILQGNDPYNALRKSIFSDEEMIEFNKCMKEFSDKLKQVNDA